MQKNDDNFRLFYCACKIDICHCSFVWDQPTQVFQSVIHAKYLCIFHNENRTVMLDAGGYESRQHGV